MVRKWVRQFNDEQINVHAEARSGLPSVVNNVSPKRYLFSEHASYINSDHPDIPKKRKSQDLKQDFSVGQNVLRRPWLDGDLEFRGGLSKMGGDVESLAFD
ncbi:hypothetical protein TNCV_4623951 [Trichonephila clavipes]|nr:hypothetical protein TNCV_4623951 [Trichonephila clavipes]